MDYDIQFNAGDISDRVHDLHRHKTKNVEEAALFFHELKNLFAVADTRLNELLENHFRELSGEQKRYLNELGPNYSKAWDETVALGNTFQQDLGGSLESIVDKHSRELDDAVRRLSLLLPIKSQPYFVSSAGAIDQSVEMADSAIRFLFFTMNLYFSPQMKSSVFYPFQQYRHWAQTFAKASGTIVVNHKLPNLESSVDYFSSVFMPLIANIQQHAYPEANGSLVEIKANTDSDKKEITVSVKDYGVGLSPKVAGRLFEKGATTKTDSRTEHGIGLWAVKEFVERNGGRIWFESVPNKGTTFYFTMPYTIKTGSTYRQ